jgi:hypothetical protein
MPRGRFATHPEIVPNRRNQDSAWSLSTNRSPVLGRIPHQNPVTLQLLAVELLSIARVREIETPGSVVMLRNPMQSLDKRGDLCYTGYEVAGTSTAAGAL